MKRAISFLMVVGILATLCACGGKESAAIGRPQIAQPGSITETNLVLTENIPVETANTINAYKLEVDLDKSKEEVQRTFGITLGQPNTNGEYIGQDYTVTIESDTGYWTYEKKETYSALEPSDSPISDAQAQTIATQFVEDNNLWSGEVYNTVVTDITEGGWNDEERLLGKSVYIYPSVDGKPILGIFRIIVSMNSDGEIFSVYKLATDIGDGVSVEVKSRSVLEEDFTEKNYSDSCSESLRSPTIEEGTLEYYADAKQVDGVTYLYPVYVFTGEGKTSDGEQETFDVILDAQK